VLLQQHRALRRRSLRRGTRHKPPRHAPRKRHAPHRNPLLVLSAALERQLPRGTPRRRRVPRLRRSSSHKPAATVPADKLDRTLPNPARAGICRAKLRQQRVLRQQQALEQQRRALRRQQHRPLASDAMGLRNKR
jgi:hypothetical protein